MGLKEKDILKRVLFYGGNAIVALIFVSPLLWMIAASLKPEAQIFSDMSTIRTFWPTAAALGNYVEVFTRVNMMKFILNSLFYVFVIVIRTWRSILSADMPWQNSIFPERSCC